MTQGLLGRHPDMMGSCGPCWLLNFRYLGVGQCQGRCRGTVGTRAQGKGLGLGCQPPPPSHSRLEAGGGLHAGSAQCPAQALDLGQKACEGGRTWKPPAPRPLLPPPTSRL